MDEKSERILVGLGAAAAGAIWMVAILMMAGGF